MFSKTCEYAIRSIIYVAQQSNAGVKVGFKEIAEAVGAPEPFVAKILQDLSRRGFLQSSKGPKGGFYVDQQSMNHTLADIVKAVDGDQLFSGCGLGLPQCSEDNPCPIHQAYKSIRQQTQHMLESATVSHFNELLDKKLVYLSRR